MIAHCTLCFFSWHCFIRLLHSIPLAFVRLHTLYTALLYTHRLAIAQRGRERSPNTPLISIHYLCCDATKSTQLMAPVGEEKEREKRTRVSATEPVSSAFPFLSNCDSFGPWWQARSSRGEVLKWVSPRLNWIKKVPLLCADLFWKHLWLWR